MAGTSVWSGGQLTRLTSDWVTVPLSADREIRYDIWRLRSRSRDVVRNNGFATRFLAILADNVLGHRGIMLDVDFMAGAEPNETLNTAIESAWRGWGHAETCSADGKLSWLDTERLTLATLAQDGEVLIRFVRGASNPYGLSLQLIDCDLLDQNMNQVASDTANEIRMGVERDIYGRPVAYHLWTFHPNDYDFAITRYGERKRIPADEILHLFLLRRPGQTRGVPWFAPVLFNTQMLRGYTEAEVVAARQAASAMGFLIPGADSDVVGNLNAPNDQPLEIAAAPGEFPTLPRGYTVHDWNPEHPGKEFSVFVKAMLREIASGLGVSYNLLANDLESVNYSSMRAGALSDRDAWRALQYWLIEHLHRRVFAEFSKMARLTGALPAATRNADEDAIHWAPRGWPWVDPLKDAEAQTLMMQNGMDSRTHALAEDGREVEPVFKELAAEKQLAAKYDIEIEAAVKTPRSPPPDTGEQGAPGGDGAEPGNGNGKNGKAREAVLAALRGGRGAA